MIKNEAKGSDSVACSIEQNIGSSEGASGGGVFHFQCHDKDGNLKWEDSCKNLVVNQGLQDKNTQYFKGASYTAAWYLGLVDAAGFTAYAAGDTMASHAGWVETTAYSGANRGTVTFGTATTADPSVITNSGSATQFAITGTVTIKGAFLTATADKTTNTGVLFSVSSFQSPGDRSVVNGDTLSCTYTYSLDSA
jgi:hypothetical protein